MRKKFLGILLAVLMTAMLFIGLTACNKSKVESISIDEAHMPQVVFVKGNELDLSKGSLNVNNGESSVSLTDSGVEVSGYNKDQLGEQTLTVRYGGAETTLIVSVVPRVRVAESYVYFVGESIGDVTMRLTVTRDDGTTFTVRSGDAGVTIDGFDSSTENDALALNLTYNKNGENYTGSFAVTIASPEFEFRKPRKEAYGNHETTVELLGASLTMKSSSGTDKNININQLTTTGYDPSVVSASNPSVTQTIHVLYGGREVGSYQITVTYSNVSKIKPIAADLQTLDWSTYDFSDMIFYPDGANETRGKAALEALELYCTLSNADSAYITDAELQAVARMAVVYGYDVWQQTLASECGDCFTAEDGILTYVAADSATAQAVADKLEAKTDENVRILFTYSELLHQTRFLDQCGELNIYAGAVQDETEADITVNDLVTGLFTSADLAELTNTLTAAVLISEQMDAVLPGWTVESLQTLQNQSKLISNVYLLLNGLKSNAKAANISLYECMNNWRADRDLFDIFYRYYYDAYEKAAADGIQTDMIEAEDHIQVLVEDFLLPRELQPYMDVFVNGYLLQTEMIRIYTALSQTGEVNASPELLDSTEFMSLYRKAKAGEERLNNLGDAMYIFVYQKAFAEPMAQMTDEILGFFDLNGTSSDDASYLALWNLYLDIYDRRNDADYVASAAWGTDVEAMLRAFVELTSAQQQNFINALMYTHPYIGLPEFVLTDDDENGICSYFTQFIYLRAMQAFGVTADNISTNTAYYIFDTLLRAAEAQMSGDVSLFYENMRLAKEAYEGTWSGFDRAGFDAKFGYFYDKYQTLFTSFNAITGTAYTFTESELPEDLKNMLIKKAYQYVSYVDGSIVFEIQEGTLTADELAAVEAELAKSANNRKEPFVEYRYNLNNDALSAEEIKLLGDISLEIFRAYFGYYYFIQSEGLPMQLSYMASYEKLCRLEAQLMAAMETNEALRMAYLYWPVEVRGSTLLDGMSIASYLYDLHYETPRYLAGITDATEYERATALRTFLADAADFLWYPVYQLSSVYFGNAFVFEPANVKGIITKFMALDIVDQYLILEWDNQLLTQGLSMYDFYYSTLLQYIYESADDPNTTDVVEKPSENLENAVYYSLSAQEAYLNYLFDPTGTVKVGDQEVSTQVYFAALFDLATEAYNKLTDAEKATFDEVYGDLYTYYKAFYDQMIAEEQQPDTQTP